MMTDDEIKKLIGTNQQLIMLLGYASAMLYGAEAYIDRERLAWFNVAIENIIYLDKPMPPLP